MPEFGLKDSILTSLNAQEPWPDSVKLFQPYEVEQILLPDNASCLAVQAFLKMCNLPFEVEMRWNAEFMSPSGRVPFIKCGAFVVSELEPIAQFAANKGVSLCARLTTEEKAEMRAYMSLITNVLVNAELYISWLDTETYNAVTKVRNSSVYPWPLGWIQTRTKRNIVAKRLKALHWHDKTLDQVMADVEQCCNSLSQRLGDKDYFFGTPTALDALIYGHTRALLAASGPRAALMIRPITTALLYHTLRIANLTRMRLTPREEYLVSQVSLLSARRARSPSPPGPARAPAGPRGARARGDARGRAGDGLRALRPRPERGDNVFGFKPFASKHIALMTTNEKSLTCAHASPPYKQIDEIDDDTYAYINDIIEKLLNDVPKAAGDGYEGDNDKEFDFVEFSSSEVGDVKPGDYLGTIEEDFTVHSETDDETYIGVDSLLEKSDSVHDSIHDSSSIQECTVYSSGDRVSDLRTSLYSEVTSVPRHEGSSATFKIPSEEVSVSKLVEYIRQKKAEHCPQVADVD